MKPEQECPRGVAFSVQGSDQACMDDCKHQGFYAPYPLTKEIMLADDFDGDWDGGGYGCDWRGWDME